VDEVRGLAVVLSRPRPVATGRGHHRDPFEPVVHVGIAGEEVLCRLFGLIETARIDEIDHRVGRLVEAVVLEDNFKWRDRWRGIRRRGRRSFGCSGGFVAGQTAAFVFLSAAAGTWVVAPNLGHSCLEAPLYTSLLTEATLWEALIAIDQDLAATAHAGGCRRCPGRVHCGDFRRKPRGGPATLPTAYEWRTSFCCARCRKRLTPPSVRFLGRRVYLGAVVVLACVLRQGPTPTRVARLRELLGVSADTLRRWHRWWRDAFVRTAFWKAVRGRFARPVDETAVPQDLLARFEGEPLTRLTALLRLLSPLTTPSAGTLGAAQG
jgi:hypothetical protein